MYTQSQPPAYPRTAPRRTSAPGTPASAPNRTRYASTRPGRSSSSPVAKQPVYSSYYHPSTVHSPDLFFISSPSSQPQSPAMLNGVLASIRPRTGPPPPPKPAVSSLQMPGRRGSSPPLPSPPFPAESPDHDADLQAALEASRTETSRQAAFLEELTSQEEEDLARALEESKLDADRCNSYSSARSEGHPTVYANEAGPSGATSSAPTPKCPSTPVDDEIPRTESPTEELPTYPGAAGKPEPDLKRPLPPSPPDSPAHALSISIMPSPSDAAASGSKPWSPSLPSTSSSQISDDEAFARRLMEEEEERHRQQSTSSAASAESDEALARRLAAEEEREEEQEAKVGPLVRSPTFPPLPTYQDAVSPAQSVRRDSLSPHPSSSTSTPDLLRTNSNGSTQSARSTWTASFVSTASPGLSPQFGASSPSLPLTTTTDQTSIAEEPGLGANHYMDADLLRGVSIGFVPPTMSYNPLEPMQGVMPNIISLPYGRCPPLHIQTPDWRHLLKMMAWLSGTRIEPTVEAIAVTKQETLHLRTVIQFVRQNPAATEWRTILWFTIDHPVPPALPGARKYTNGDVDILPWSYTLSNPPPLLRDSADTPVSKTYTVPSTETLPYPPLPITFPSLAMYLQAALDESRRYMHDSSSGMRKLAKMLETCYPGSISEPGTGPSGSGMGGLIKWVWKKGKSKSKNGRGGGNEDTYMLVTPFVPDQVYMGR